MAISRGELKGKVLRLLMKTAEYPGPYTDDKINDALHEALDTVAAEMFLANEGWLTRKIYLDTAAGQICVDIPVSVAMIKEVRYLQGNAYVPLVYDDRPKAESYPADSAVRQFASSYKISDNTIYFDPPQSEGGARYLELEVMAFPTRLTEDSQLIDAQFHAGFLHFMKYKTASVLAASVEKFAVSWASHEQYWYEKTVAMIAKRNMQVTPIREFEG